jgi:hypothetical protein
MTRACGRPRHRRTAVGGGALAVELCPRRAVWLAVAFALDGAASLAGAVAVGRGGRSLQDGGGGAGAAGTNDTQTVTNAGNDGNDGGRGGATNAKGCTESSGRERCFWDDPYYIGSMVAAIVLVMVLLFAVLLCVRYKKRLAQATQQHHQRHDPDPGGCTGSSAAARQAQIWAAGRALTVHEARRWGGTGAQAAAAPPVPLDTALALRPPPRAESETSLSPDSPPAAQGLVEEGVPSGPEVQQLLDEDKLG